MNILKNITNFFSSGNNFILRVFTWIVMGYMLLAISWWTILLFSKTSATFDVTLEQARMELASDGNYIDEPTFLESDLYKSLHDDYMAQQWMVFREATFLIICLIIAIIFISKGYNQLIESSDQQRNFLL